MCHIHAAMAQLAFCVHYADMGYDGNAGDQPEFFMLAVRQAGDAPYIGNHIGNKEQTQEEHRLKITVIRRSEIGSRCDVVGDYAGRGFVTRFLILILRE